MRGRPTVTHYVYGDPENPTKVTSTTTRSPWTPEDRALMVAYQLYLDSLCDDCGMPKAQAHHPDNEGWYEIEIAAICYSCTAVAQFHDDKAPEAEQLRIVHDRDYVADPLPVLTEDVVIHRRSAASEHPTVKEASL